MNHLQTQAVAVPLGPPALLLGVSGAVLFFKRRSGSGRCNGCGYDLKGLPGSLCPECGAEVRELDPR